jgi:phosphomannomutase
VDSHHIILLLIHYMVHYKKMSGKAITAFSVTEKVKTLCKHYGLEQITTQIGFKNISGYFVTDDVLLGGEESGGIAVKGHIPERDGIWMGMILWEFMAKSGKSLKALIQEVYAITGSFSYDRLDMHLTEEKKQRAMDIMASRPAIMGGKEVRGVETIDGIKYLFDQDAWLLVRASGTEPVVRIYAETPTAEETRLFLDKVKIDLGLGEG